MTNYLVTKALKNAYYSQSPDKNKKLIFHSDLGSQYWSYVNILDTKTKLFYVQYIFK